MTVSIIVAISNNNGIGKNNELLWHLPNDLKMFKSVTSGHCIIMGRKTYESIGKPLPNRTNIVVSNQKSLKIEGCEVVNSIQEALVVCKQKVESEAFIVGGEQIYQAALPFADRIYLTRVNCEKDADAFFPFLKQDEWKIISNEKQQQDEKHAFNYAFEVFDRSK
jgi:dihydrofolate reductase